MLQILKNFTLLVFLAALASCSSVFETLEQNNTDEPPKIVIAVLLPISGNNTNLSTSLLRSLELANKNNLNKNIIIKIYDTKGQATEAKKQMKQAIKDKAKIVIGPIFAKETAIIADMAAKHNIPILTLSNDIRLLKKYSNVIMLNHLPFSDTEATIYYAKHKGSKRVAILAPSNAYGDLSINFITESLKQNHLTLVKTVRYNPKRANLTYYINKLIPYSERIKHYRAVKAIANGEEIIGKDGKVLTEPELPSLDFDTLIIADEGQRLALVTSYFPMIDLPYKKLTILGNSQWDSNLVRSNTVLQHSYYVSNIKSPEDTTFYKEYVAYYKTSPHVLGYTIYDAFMLATSLIYQDNENNTVIGTNLVQIYDTRISKGVLAPFSINHNNTISQEVAIKQIRGYKNHLITTLKPQDFLKITDYKELLNNMDKKAEEKAKAK